jgi:hypothetical protein
MYLARTHWSDTVVSSEYNPFNFIVLNTLVLFLSWHVSSANASSSCLILVHFMVSSRLVVYWRSAWSL